ncbi:DUF6173 family protein [Cognatishimia sp. F0-27]|uniref:DUF6173 family protein n=1 Tax=Cognatishimia sp. F0-27 TaxID=2816855 RepID=UPI001D0C6CC2|nr:DUF6173 family protein [Cognatishimia sp. F0-27]MCC1494196.1 hypothetical protein [Cognatishimia sp. F0-27]
MDDKIATAAEAAEGAALPRRIDVHTDGTQPECEQALSPKPQAHKSPAEWGYERLVLYIQNFEAQLDSDHEIAMGFAGGEAGVLRIEGIGFFDPDMITFYGTDQHGARMQLIQHISQLSVVLRALPKIGPQERPRRIGFELARALSPDESKAADATAETATE